MNLSIVIASHGDERWRLLAEQRALPSAHAQGVEVLIGHEPDGNRAQVRNRLASAAAGDWLCFLDADDELAPGYADAMSKAEQRGCLLTPAVSYIRGGTRKAPMFWPETDMVTGNWMVVGTVIEKSLFGRVGGWKHLDATGQTNEYDDWHLWCRCVKAGATPVKVPDAVYIAHILRTSKHRHSTPQQRLAWHREVAEDVWGPQ